MVVAAAHLLVVPVTAWHSATYDPAAIPVHENIALLPVQFFQVHWPERPLAYASMQSKDWFLAGHAIANALLAAGAAGETIGLPSPVLTPLAIVEVVDAVVVEDVVLRVVVVGADVVVLAEVEAVLLAEVEVDVVVLEIDVEVDVDAFVLVVEEVVVVVDSVVVVVGIVVEIVVVGGMVDVVVAEVVEVVVVEELTVVICGRISASAWLTGSTTIPDAFIAFIWGRNCGWGVSYVVSPAFLGFTQW